MMAACGMLPCVLSSGFAGILVEASAAGEPAVLLWSLCFGVFLGVFYDLFRVVRTVLGLHRELTVGAWTKRLRSVSFRSVLCSRDVTERDDGKQRDSRWRKTLRSVLERIGDKLPGPRWWLLLVLDLLFFGLSAIFAAVFVYAANAGVLRWYILLLTGIGFFVYYRTAGYLVMRITVFLLATVHALCAVFFNCTLYYPCKGLVYLFCRVKHGVRPVCRQRKMKRKDG
ncbi:MAG: spore cortex biosynthesis protein YabQ [Clostridia bacterium]|nr:spore cortex biosynthesis protein YabQ [Clostridia bacterium]